MKRVFLILFLVVFASNISFAEEMDYAKIYSELEAPTFSYLHGMDPGQYYDNKTSTWSPYPLFRLSSPLYFKNVTIPPGYYLLTPTTYKGDPYILFKEVGLVKYIIPVYKKEFVPEGFYEAHIPAPKLSFAQKVSKNLYGYVGKHFKSAKRTPPPQSYLEVTDLDNKFISIIIYYGPYRYYTIMRTIRM